jgi:hypothetical protein
MFLTLSRASSRAGLVLWAGLSVAVSGCGGGVGVGGGQGPDPVVLDVAIAYVKRPVPRNQAGNIVTSNAKELRTFNIGADLYVRDRAAPSAAERNVTGAMTKGQYDVRDLEVSWDGTRVIFAMRGPIKPGAQEKDQPKWAVWEYTVAGDSLRRVISSDVVAYAGHDVAPHYLPDGRIVFSSTRQRQSGAVLIDEGKPQFPAQDEDRNEPAFVLHVMDADGGNIHQVSFNQSHDQSPGVLATGEVVFTRWDHAGGVDSMALYSMNPDGTNLQLLYGRHSHATGTNNAVVQFLQPRPMPDGTVLALLRPFQTDSYGGLPVVIDTSRYVENVQPLIPNVGVLNGPAQAAAVSGDIHTDGTPSPGGHYSAAWPLDDGTGRILASWSPCRLLENQAIVPCTSQRLASPTAQEAAPLYGLWILDRGAGTQLPVLQPQENFMYTDVVVIQPRTLPPAILDQDATGALNPNLVAEGAGILKIRSVYDVDGVDTTTPNIATVADPAQTTADQRTARFLRIEKAVAIPDRDTRDFRQTAFGVNAGQGMREIIGYAMI